MIVSCCGQVCLYVLPRNSPPIGHSPVAVTDDVHGRVATRTRASPSSGSQRQWAGEKVCRGYTFGYMTSRRCFVIAVSNGVVVSASVGRVALMTCLACGRSRR